ncbi:hypothetical protein [Flavobacterium sp. LB3R33]|uniref:hypothetical protein n=1 Tax=Flavobacterium sp. LB3R33 TaxID=3401721 RepID=UPI003AB08DBA
MKVKLHNTQLSVETNSFEDRDAYYLISLNWSLINEEYITFVRKEVFGYCYNLDWAGPVSKFDAEKKVIKDKIVMVHQSRIRPFVVKVIIDEIECFVLPNIEEVRKIVGFDDINLQLVV